MFNYRHFTEEKKFFLFFLGHFTSNQIYRLQYREFLRGWNGYFWNFHRFLPKSSSLLREDSSFLVGRVRKWKMKVFKITYIMYMTCVYTCTYIHTYECMSCVCTYIHTYIHTCVHTYTYRVHVCTWHVHMYMCTHVHVIKLSLGTFVYYV